MCKFYFPFHAEHSVNTKTKNEYTFLSPLDYVLNWRSASNRVTSRYLTQIVCVSVVRAELSRWAPR